MPIFFFDLVEINGTIRRDTVGVELADASAARLEAKKTLAGMSVDAINHDLSELRIQVRDTDRKVVALRVAHFQDEDAGE